MKRSNWNHVMALTTVFAILGTGWVWAGTNAWTSIGPQGGWIEALSIDPHNPRTLYAATSGGAFKSLDGGANWVKSGMPNKLLVFDPHMGLIDIAAGGREVHDPMSPRPPGHRSPEKLLRSARDGSASAIISQFHS